MLDCDHEYTLESIENPSGAEGQGITRTIWLLCSLCAHRQPRLTNRSDDQINAEIEANNA
jgi:hypothetical protein